MKNYSILFLLAIAALAGSCVDDEPPLGPTTTVNLNITGVYDADPLVMINQTYNYQDGRQVVFQEVNFFISEVVLFEADGGDEVELVDIDFVSFSNNSSVADAETPQTFSANRIPAGSYAGVRIGFGVPADLNNSSANQFGENHPLRKNFGQFWSGWDSFIFTMINGQYDENGDGVFDGDDPGFNHHLGSDAVYRNVTISHPIQLEEGQPFDLNMVFDLKKIYGTEADFLDLTDPTNRQTHSPDDLSIADFMTQNFETAVTVE